MGKRSEVSGDGNGVSGMNQSMRGHPHVQERTEVLIKKAVQLTLLIEFLENRRAINSDEYCETLLSLPRSIKNKRPELFPKGVVQVHDNTRPHISRVTYVELTKFKFKQLDHPPYSPDMSPCDFSCVW
ncbi:histone-lysine N-methyltransferase SETMAR [Trichonephila inaurata madagascariensis]|uniref:Histone-lysine N-methyltransferase SETMAR n=1 Tax=Trichonephila inaurata madagascariensis TaxID=2747483 RepID=A0A8X7CG37_9ARAC|nr:histone-lysine N-methyltransferase SETMAR [Trichonephila inaurata madagascariensis]